MIINQYVYQTTGTGDPLRLGAQVISGIGFWSAGIVPSIGHYQMGQVTPAMLDDLFVKLSEKGLSDTSVKYVKRVLSVSFETARKHKYVEVNPVKDITTKFGKKEDTGSIYHSADAASYVPCFGDGMGNTGCAGWVL